ncbi:MAG: ABC transporter ATP-binding protein [Clostridiales bacterium]|nr:ABC transporter ATP-binding protein [Clostridiales bacterium]
MGVTDLPNAIEVNDVSMVFNMTEDKVLSIKEYLLKFVQGKIRYRAFFALTGVTFTVEKGDIFGIVGLNGSGKSTLLKIISGIMKPTLGKVSVAGSIAPLIELGAGFNMELTARENIFLNASVLGYSKQYIKDKFDEIVEFSEMRSFLDVPMKNYSSGMVARIGFAVATVTKPSVLIIDEILGVGDFLFQQKCEKRINDLMSGGTTVLLVSHSIEQIRSMCKHAMWLEKGHMKMIGEASNVCMAYQGV